MEGVEMRRLEAGEKSRRTSEEGPCRSCRSLHYLVAALAGACLGLTVAALRPGPVQGEPLGVPVELLPQPSAIRLVSTLDGPAPDRGTALGRRFAGARDPWLYGPSLQIFLADGRLRPYLRLSAGRDTSPTELDAARWLSLELPERFGGSMGGGLSLRLDERIELDLNASHYRGRDGPTAARPFTHIGTGLRFWF